MARFEDALPILLTHEGGYADDTDDHGGATKWGISLRYLRGLGPEWGDVDGDGDVDEEDIRRLPPDIRDRIYREKWWDRLLLGELEDQPLATKILDLAVNMGRLPAVKILQYALHAAGQPYVIVDGIMGPQTLRAANSADPGRLLAIVRSVAAAYYEGLVQANPGLRKWRRGWIARALS